MIVIINGFIPVSEFNFKDGSSMFLPRNELRNYNLKVIRSGDIVEVYAYDKKVYYNYEGFQCQKDKVKSEDWNGKSENSLRRSRRNIRRVIWSNISQYSKFLTLTYAENMQDLDKFYFDWKMFVKSMSRKGYCLKYLYVLEYQERGSIHAHVLIFNDEFIPWQAIKDSWTHGVIDIHKIRDIGNLGAYVCKYLTKDTLAEYNSKSYHCSRGLKRSVERKITLEDAEPILQELFATGEVTYTNKYNVTYDDIVANEVMYCQIKLHKTL